MNQILVHQISTDVTCEERYRLKHWSAVFVLNYRWFAELLSTHTSEHDWILRACWFRKNPIVLIFTWCEGSEFTFFTLEFFSISSTFFGWGYELRMSLDWFFFSRIWTILKISNNKHPHTKKSWKKYLLSILLQRETYQNPWLI